METLNFLAGGFTSLLQPAPLIALFLGVLVGLVIGVIPGVGGTTGVAVLLPLTVIMPPTAALVLLAAVYWGSMYGGAITSILFGIPGNPWSVATMFDGRPLARKGKAGLALTAAFVVSFVGALVATLFFTVAALPFAELALAFTFPELFGVLLIAFGTFVGLGGNPFKALIMLCLGFIFAIVGMDPVTGTPRLTFGEMWLLEGFHFVPVTIGLYGIGEVLSNAYDRYRVKTEALAAATRVTLRDFTETLRTLARRKWLILFSSMLGFFVGLLPGVGATPGSFIAYGVARRTSRHPEEFGKGALDGVMAPEAANNAAGTGSILPMLVLGIPGSPTAAIIMAGIFMWGFLPGPRLLFEAGDLVWAFIASLYVANLLAVVICLTSTPLLAAVLRTPYGVLAPTIVVLSLLGAWSIRFSFFDVWTVMAFGVVGFVLQRLNYPLAPLVVALVLADPTETTLRQSLIMGGGSLMIFFERPIAAVAVVIGILLFLLPLFQLIWHWIRARLEAQPAR
jgi:putative tricarboxylic transport membrane protein